VQTQPLPGTRGQRQSKNNAGGFVFTLDKWDQLNRFLILGTVGGTYYVSEKTLTQDNANVLFDCAAEDGKRFVDTIVDVSVNGRAPKVQPALFALAIAASADDKATRSLALDAIQKVCRTGTHLFTFVGFVKQFRGTGSRGMRRALGSWYTAKPVDKVAYQAIKYRSREGYTHRDLLRIAHPNTTEPERKALFEWITKGTVPQSAESLRFVNGFILAQEAQKPADTAKIVRDFNLPWEAIKTEHLNDGVVWDALLDKAPTEVEVQDASISCEDEVYERLEQVITSVYPDTITNESLRGKPKPITIGRCRWVPGLNPTLNDSAGSQRGIWDICDAPFE
jgi:60 kDa SS-A/Ro ribonucleoprotein